MQREIEQSYRAVGQIRGFMAQGLCDAPKHENWLLGHMWWLRDHVDHRRETLAETLRSRGDLPEGLPASLDSSEVFTSPEQTYTNGCHICEVEIDPATGIVDIVGYAAVDDCGTVVNPMIVHGQVHGGVAQGLGQVLGEHAIYDSEGQLLAGSFMDYMMPRADDIPDFRLGFHPTHCTTNPLGAKGAG